MPINRPRNLIAGSHVDVDIEIANQQEELEREKMRLAEEQIQIGRSQERTNRIHLWVVTIVSGASLVIGALALAGVGPS